MAGYHTNFLLQNLTCLIWLEIGPDWHQMRQILRPSKSILVNFEQNVLTSKITFKKSRIAQFGPNVARFRTGI